MPKSLLDDLGMNSLREQHRGRSVAQVVESDNGNSRSLEQRQPRLTAQVASQVGRPFRGDEDQLIRPVSIRGRKK